MPADFRRATPVLRAREYERARAFYRDSLGFEVVEEGGDPPRFGIFKRGPAYLFIDSWHGGRAGPAPGWNAYLHVDGLDAFVTEIESRGVRLSRGPEVTNYGMREAEVLDPDGNILCFGEDA